MEELNQVMKRVEKTIQLTLSEEKHKKKCSECGVEDDHKVFRKFNGITTSLFFPNSLTENYDGALICNKCRHKKNRSEETKQRIENIEKTLFKIGIRKRYFECSLENFKGGDKYIKFCRKWLENPKESLFFTGPFGCGKTHLAVALCRELIKKEELFADKTYLNLDFRFSIDLLYEIKKTFDKEKKWNWQSGEEKPLDTNEYINKFSNSDLDYLVLDDLGAEKSTEWAVETLSLIIDRRDRDMLPTIVTSNLTLEEIGERISGRIASRLANGKIIKIDMPDHRMKRV